MFLKLSWIVFDCKQFFIYVYFSPKSDQITFSVERVIYFSQKQQFEVKKVLMMDLFLTNMQLISSQDVN